MDLIFGPKGKKWHKEIRSLPTPVYGSLVTRDFPTAVDSGAEIITSAVYAIIHATDGILDLNGAPGVAMRLVLSNGTTTDKVAVKFYGSVDGTNYFDVHQTITGSIDPIINDYGAIDMAIEASTGLRKLAVYAKRTAGVAGDGTVQVVWQPKFDAAAVNSAEAVKKFIDSCADLTRGHVGMRVTNWPGNNVTPYNFVDTTNLAAATYYLPSSTGLSLQGIRDLSITGKLISGTADNTLTFTQEVCNDEDLAGDWEQIQFLDDTTGNVVDSFTVVNATQNLCIPNREIGVYQNYRIKLVVANTGVLTNTISIKGYGCGGA